MSLISDRLHGGLIAALMMRKKVIFLPVGYHKIRSFFGVAAVEFRCCIYRRSRRSSKSIGRVEVNQC